jgi:7,8-dihydropterin-6-yl-methyl-4-(beta-D-ribofuranosyl)aminobenzene 5'-phosphate synthase
MERVAERFIHTGWDTLLGRDVRIDVLVDDIAPEGLRTVHGFAALVRAGGLTVLFDTGPEGELLLEALERVGVAPDVLDLVVLSHHHRDHSGGLPRLLYDRPRLEVSVPKAAASDISRMLPRDAVLLGEAGLRSLGPGVRVTGDLGGDTPEQSMLLDTAEGTVVLVGCGHPGLRALLSAAGGPPRLMVGGLHALTAGELDMSGVGDLVACHCTPSKRSLAHRFERVALGGVGTVIDMPDPGPGPLPP